MKYCEEYAALLDLFADGELPADQLERVRDHLAECPSCRAYVDDALTIRAGFPDVEETAVPEGFAEGVMERVRETSGRSGKVVELRDRRVRRRLGTAAALAACCALVILLQTGPAAPAGGGDRMARMSSDTTAACDAGEAGIESQAAPEDDAAEENKETERTLMTAKDAGPDLDAAAGAAENRRGPLTAASPTAPAEEPVTEEGQTKSVLESVMNDTASDYEEFALCLTAQEVGNLLDSFTPEQESETERRYRLNAEEYETLLKDLGCWEKLPEAPESGFQVVVTGPFK